MVWIKISTSISRNFFLFQPVRNSMSFYLSASRFRSRHRWHFQDFRVHITELGRRNSGELVGNVDADLARQGDSLRSILLLLLNLIGLADNFRRSLIKIRQGSTGMSGHHDSSGNVFKRLPQIDSLNGDLCSAFPWTCKKPKKWSQVD